MDATLDLVATVGLLKTTISKISRQAECSPGIVYHHFNSKDDIVNLLYEVVLDEMTAYVVTGYDTDEPFLTRFKRFWIRIYEYHLSHPKNAVFFEQFKNSSYYTPAMEAVSAKYLKIYADMFDADAAAKHMASYPLEVIQALTWDVAKNLARVHAKQGIRFDDDTLNEIAERSCKSVSL